MDTNHRDGENPSATVWGVGIHRRACCSGCLLEPPRPALCHIPQTAPALLPTPATLGSDNRCQAPFLQGLPPHFFLSLEDPEPEVDGTGVGHGLKQRKGTWRVDEAEMPTPPSHVGALHDTPLDISGNCYFAAFCLDSLLHKTWLPLG